MTLKDLSAFLSPNLELPWQGRVFVVKPPTKEVGLTLTAINVAGIGAYSAIQGACESCGRSGKVELSDTHRALAEAAEDKDLGELTLGAAYQEMTDAGIPAPDIDMFSLYAFYYWILGEDAADGIIAQKYQKQSEVNRPVPKDRLPRKSTQSTGSANQSAKTKTGSKSTQTTDSQKK